MSVMITGGCGFLGLNLARSMVAEGKKAILFDRHPAIPAYFGELLGTENITLIKGDILEYGELLEAVLTHKVENIVHCAALWGEPNCREQPLASLNINVIGSANVLDLARLLPLRRVILISSRAAYGEYTPEEGPTGEGFLPRPAGFYGAGKAAADLVCESYRRQFGLDVVSLRVTGLYGAGQTFPTPVGNFVLAALRGESIRMASGGDYRYEFNYVTDVVNGIVSALDAPRLKNALYNVGCGLQYSLTEIAETIKKHIPTWRFEIGPGYPTDISPRAALDASRFREEVGYAPQYHLQDGIGEYIGWLKGEGAGQLAVSAPTNVLDHALSPKALRDKEQ